MVICREMSADQNKKLSTMDDDSGDQNTSTMVGNNGEQKTPPESMAMRYVLIYQLYSYYAKVHNSELSGQVTTKKLLSSIRIV